MRRIRKHRVAIVFLLLAILAGGTVGISVSVMEITFALILAFAVGTVTFFLIASRLKKKRK